MKPMTDQETTKAWRELKRKSWSTQPFWPLVEAGYVSFDLEECWTITKTGLDEQHVLHGHQELRQAPQSCPLPVRPRRRAY